MRQGTTDFGRNGENSMKTKFTYYKEDEMWIGWLEEYPDYRTQGESLPELKENLKDIYRELTSGNIPGVRKVGELVVK
jgi:hypothetical protein